jgi:hypothetical protein
MKPSNPARETMRNRENADTHPTPRGESAQSRPQVRVMVVCLGSFDRLDLDSSRSLVSTFVRQGRGTVAPRLECRSREGRRRR